MYLTLCLTHCISEFVCMSLRICVYVQDSPVNRCAILHRHMCGFITLCQPLRLYDLLNEWAYECNLTCEYI